MKTSLATSTTESLATLVAPVQEVFSSVQGEGIDVGKRQVFVRFSHCHLKCTYCDTPMSREDGKCHVETEPGTGVIERLDNPLPAETLVAVVQALLAKTPHDSVSFTGGEPLLYHRYLQTVLPQIRPQAKIYLETSGTQPEFLAPVLPWVDIIAMDIKLPSATGEPALPEAQRAFYELAKNAAQGSDNQTPTLFIKLVFNNALTEDECQMVETIVTDKTTPLILQPETDLVTRQPKVSARKLLAVQARFARSFKDVRVIPQTHKMLQVF